MEYVLIALKLIVGISILNVWLLQPTKATKWRGGDGKTIKEEFTAYGIPESMVYVIGFFKVTLSILLIASGYFTEIPLMTQVSTYGLLFFLSGSVLMHLKIKDPLFKSFPAALFLVLLVVIVYFS